MSNTDSDTLKIPAFRRKRSIQGRARKKLLLTALDRKKAGVSVVKKVARRRCAAARRPKPTSDFTPPMVFSEPISNADLGNMSSSSSDTALVSDVSAASKALLASRLSASRTSLPDLRKMRECGICEGYLNKIEVAIVRLTRALRVGDRVLFETRGGLFEQTVESMQINRKDVKLARSGSDIGLKVLLEPMKSGRVYKVV